MKTSSPDGGRTGDQFDKKKGEPSEWLAEQKWPITFVQTSSPLETKGKIFRSYDRRTSVSGTQSLEGTQRVGRIGPLGRNAFAVDSVVALILECWNVRGAGFDSVI